MRRITVEEVKAAYEKTGLKPVRGTTCYLGRAHAFNEGCPIDAMIFGKLKDKFCTLDVCEVLGVSMNYLEGFVLGVDGCNRSSHPDHRLGLEDGIAVRLAIFGEPA
jgi:hypothetical protein